MKAIMPAYPIDLCDTRKQRLQLRHTSSSEKPRQSTRIRHSNILTSNSEMLRLVRIAQQVANTDVPVLMVGESGVGKEVFADFIHNESSRFGIRS